MIGLTLGGYLLRRSFLAILAVFGLVAALIALLDFIEMFRRVSDLPAGSGGQAALLTLMRAPSIAEQVLPFSVLFGSMVALASLSRRLELVVARAAGISAWQFLGPPVLAVVIIGVLSVTAYNPLAALLKERADAIETALFSRLGGSGSSDALWIRQRSGDGQAILRADRSSDDGVRLADVSVFVFNDDDVFEQRIEAAGAQLLAGRWRLTQVRIFKPGEAPRQAKAVMLPTSLTPAEVTQSFVAPASVPFWELPRTIAETDQAGLDSAPYRLQYQSLLARPLLLVAMVLIAACFSLRFFRFGGVLRTAAGGVAAGFVLYVVTKLVGDLGGAGVLSARAAAWSPAVVASMLGALVLLHQEDG